MKCITQREPKPQERGTRSWYTLPAIFGLLLAPAPYLLAQVVVEPIPGSLSNHTVIQADGTKTAPLPAGLSKFLKKMQMDP